MTIPCAHDARYFAGFEQPRASHIPWLTGSKYSSVFLFAIEDSPLNFARYKTGSPSFVIGYISASSHLSLYHRGLMVPTKTGLYWDRAFGSPVPPLPEKRNHAAFFKAGLISMRRGRAATAMGALISSTPWLNSAVSFSTSTPSGRVTTRSKLP